MAKRDFTHLTKEDITAVCNRIQDVSYSLLSIREMAFAADENRDHKFLLHGIAELARAEFKGLDACIERLGELKAGNFPTEFDA